MKPQILLEGFSNQELIDELYARKAVPPFSYRLVKYMDWLNENAPLVLWKGSKADGTPAFDVLDADDDGRLLESLEGDAISLGTGTDIASAIDDAREQEEARP